MQVTLRKARQIEKLLTKKFNEHVETIELISIHESLHDLSATITNTISTFSDDMLKLEAINGAMFELRADIGNANEVNGINGLIGDRAKLTSLLNRIKMFSQLETMDSVDVAKSRIKAYLAAPTNAYGGTVENYELQRCSVGQLDSLKRRMDDLKLDIVRLDDMILSNNVTVNIIISQRVHNLLDLLRIPY